MAQIRHTLWTELDEFGAILELPRHPDEPDQEYIRRLKQRMVWKPGTTPQGLVNALSVEFGLTPYKRDNKQFFRLTHAPENLDRKIATQSDELGNATVNGKAEYGTLRVFVDDNHQVFGTNLQQYGEFAPGLATMPDGWLYPEGYVPIVKGEFDFWGLPGYIIWKDDEGNYTRNLEFLFYTPPTDAQVRVEYVYKDEGGKHQYFSDFSNPDNSLDTSFIGISGTVPGFASGVVVLEPKDLTMEGESLGRKELAQRIRNLYGNTWNNFKWGSYTWENANLVPSGSIPSHYDANIGTIYNEFMGGTGSDCDLLINQELDISEILWRPQVRSGTFFLGSIPHYLYEDRRSRIWEADLSFIDISGSYDGSPITVTNLTGLPATPSGLIPHATRMYGYHPSGNQTPWAWEHIPNFVNLDGVDSFTWSPGDDEFWTSTPDWLSIPASGASPTAPIRVNSPSGLGTDLQVYYEADSISGVGSVIQDIDVNPTNSYRNQNKFLVIDDEVDLDPSGYINIYSRTDEIVHRNDIFRIGGHILGSNGASMNDAKITINVSGVEGYPVDVHGLQVDEAKYTAADGTFRFDFHVQQIVSPNISVKVTSDKSLVDSNIININHPSGVGPLPHSGT